MSSLCTLLVVVRRSDASILPFLSAILESRTQCQGLMIYFRSEYELGYGDSADLCEIHDEAALAAFELPHDAATTDSATRHTLFGPVLGCTVITAVRGGQLRRLSLAHGVRQLFLIPALLPYWVGLDHFSGLNAPASLRPRLAHVSLWLGSASDSKPREHRRLTAQDVQGLRLYFKTENMIAVSADTHLQHQPFEPYLVWLEDKDLAQQVADTWNAVVQRGGANLRKCCCKKCEGMRRCSEQGESLM